MKLRHLETFIIVADELHFGRAAARLHVAQPAVSQTISGLEDSLGVELFDRTRRQVRLTEAGERFLEDTRRILGDLEQAKHSARRLAAGERGQLRIGFTVACAMSRIPSAIADFMKSNPGVEVSLRQLGTAAQLEALALGRLDIGFSVLAQPDDSIQRRLVAPDRLHVFLPAQHPLAVNEEVHVSDALRCPFVLMTREQEPQMHHAFHGLCRELGIEPAVVLEVDHLEAMLAFVAAGLGVSFAPSATNKLDASGVISRPLVPFIAVDIHALWSEQNLSPATRRFLQHIDGSLSLTSMSQR